MRTIWNEYGGMVLGVAGAAAVIKITLGTLLSGGSIYEIIMTFSCGIC